MKSVENWRKTFKKKGKNQPIKDNLRYPLRESASFCMSTSFEDQAKHEKTLILKFYYSSDSPAPLKVDLWSSITNIQINTPNIFESIRILPRRVLNSGYLIKTLHSSLLYQLCHLACMLYTLVTYVCTSVTDYNLMLTGVQSFTSFCTI